MIIKPKNTYYIAIGPSKYTSKFVGNTDLKGGLLRAKGREIISAVFMTGLPSIDAIQIKNYSVSDEFRLKLSIMNMIFEERRDSGNRRMLVRRSGRFIDPSEGTFLSYYEGMFLTTLVGMKIYGMQWMTHLSIVESDDLNHISYSNRMSKVRPDIIGERYRNGVEEYGVFEAKGSESSCPPYRGIKKAINQVDQVKDINGVIPMVRVAIGSYSGSGYISLYIRESNGSINSSCRISDVNIPFLIEKKMAKLFKENQPFKESGVAPNVVPLNALDNKNTKAIRFRAFDNYELDLSMDLEIYNEFQSNKSEKDISETIKRKKESVELFELVEEADNKKDDEIRDVYKMANETFRHMQRCPIAKTGKGRYTIGDIMGDDEYWSRPDVIPMRNYIGRIIANYFDDLVNANPDIEVRYEFCGRNNSGHGLYRVHTLE